MRYAQLTPQFPWLWWIVGANAAYCYSAVMDDFGVLRHMNENALYALA